MQVHQQQSFRMPTACTDGSGRRLSAPARSNMAGPPPPCRTTAQLLPTRPETPVKASEPSQMSSTAMPLGNASVVRTLPPGSAREEVRAAAVQGDAAASQLAAAVGLANITHRSELAPVAEVPTVPPSPKHECESDGCEVASSSTIWDAGGGSSPKDSSTQGDDNGNAVRHVLESSMDSVFSLTLKTNVAAQADAAAAALAESLGLNAQRPCARADATKLKTADWCADTHIERFHFGRGEANSLDVHDACMTERIEDSDIVAQSNLSKVHHPSVPRLAEGLSASRSGSMRNTCYDFADRPILSSRTDLATDRSGTSWASGSVWEPASARLMPLTPKTDMNLVLEGDEEVGKVAASLCGQSGDSAHKHAKLNREVTHNQVAKEESCLCSDSLQEFREAEINGDRFATSLLNVVEESSKFEALLLQQQVLQKLDVLLARIASERQENLVERCFTAWSRTKGSQRDHFSSASCSQSLSYLFVVWSAWRSAINLRARERLKQYGQHIHFVLERALEMRDAQYDVPRARLAWHVWRTNIRRSKFQHAFAKRAIEGVHVIMMYVCWRSWSVDVLWAASSRERARQAMEVQLLRNQLLLVRAWCCWCGWLAAAARMSKCTAAAIGSCFRRSLLSRQIRTAWSMWVAEIANGRHTRDLGELFEARRRVGSRLTLCFIAWHARSRNTRVALAVSARSARTHDARIWSVLAVLTWMSWRRRARERRMLMRTAACTATCDRRFLLGHAWRAWCLRTRRRRDSMELGLKALRIHSVQRALKQPWCLWNKWARRRTLLRKASEFSVRQLVATDAQFLLQAVLRSWTRALASGVMLSGFRGRGRRIAAAVTFAAEGKLMAGVLDEWWVVAFSGAASLAQRVVRAAAEKRKLRLLQTGLQQTFQWPWGRDARSGPMPSCAAALACWSRWRLLTAANRGSGTFGQHLDATARADAAQSGGDRRLSAGGSVEAAGALRRHSLRRARELVALQRGCLSGEVRDADVDRASVDLVEQLYAYEAALGGAALQADGEGCLGFALGGDLASAAAAPRRRRFSQPPAMTAAALPARQRAPLEVPALSAASPLY
eukprot:TRINITY_DN26043_c0_g1_i1.p1 TRINITY_DN26043_c0_g1~~TRINITY_DN26043_c0_g1_i1.p1  ORF type:complete len:1070 (-),score=165.30 TRINITY_DN26043_c0_g1_i1:104-3313(-)